MQRTAIFQSIQTFWKEIALPNHILFISNLLCFQKNFRQPINYFHHLKAHKKSSRVFTNQFSLSNVISV